MGVAFVYLSYRWGNHNVRDEIPNEIMVKYMGAKQVFPLEFQAFGAC